MSYCCVNCFDDDFLKFQIQERGERNNCDFCGSINVYCIDPKELADFFEPLMGIYSAVDDFLPMEELKRWDGEYIWDKLQSDWEIFNDDYDCDQEKLIKCMFSPSNPSDPELYLLDSYVERESEYFGIADEKEGVLRGQWEEFVEVIKNNNRFLHGKRILDEELLLSLIQELEFTMKQKSILFRSRNSYNEGKIECSDMGMPDPIKAKSARANPVGIPYLYCASDIETAIYENRPSITDNVTVAHFEVIEPIKVIDLRFYSPFVFWRSEDFESAISQIDFFYKLGENLTKPINPKVAEIEYLSTQYICELIKYQGWEGVLYKSCLGEGYNVALFSQDKVKCTNTDFFNITAQNYKYKEL